MPPNSLPLVIGHHHRNGLLPLGRRPLPLLLLVLAGGGVCLPPLPLDMLQPGGWREERRPEGCEQHWQHICTHPCFGQQQHTERASRRSSIGQAPRMRMAAAAVCTMPERATRSSWPAAAVRRDHSSRPAPAVRQEESSTAAQTQRQYSSAPAAPAPSSAARTLAAGPGPALDRPASGAVRPPPPAAPPPPHSAQPGCLPETPPHPTPASWGAAAQPATGQAAQGQAGRQRGKGRKR